MARQPSCLCGDCRRCKHREYMREYLRRPAAAEANRQRAASYRERNLDEVRARDRSRGFRGDALKMQARNLLNRALSRGEIERDPCEVCGESPVGSDGRSLVQAHHEDYSRPLDVRWLCTKHHGEIHRRAVVA